MGGFKRFGGGGGNKELSERKMYLSRSISPTVGPTNWQSRLVPRGATALATLISQGATALVSAVLRWEGSKDLGGAAATKN